ncbi:MAG: glycosyltransferase [Micrococcaceae bacterium]
MIRVIAVNYFTSGIVPEFVESFVKQDFEEWEIYIVDNSENTEELQKLSELTLDDRVTIIDSQKNRGFLGASAYCYNNFITHKMEKKDLVVISNLDLQLGSSQELSKIIECNNTYDNVGVFAPDIVSVKRNDHQNPMLNSRPSKRAMQLRKLMFHNTLTTQLVTTADIYSAPIRDKFKKDTTTLEERSIYAAHGSFMIITEAFFAKGGTLDYKIFLFDEEIFIAEQCRKLDLLVKFIPSVKIVHISNATFGTKRSKKVLQSKVDATQESFKTLFQN